MGSCLSHSVHSALHKLYCAHCAERFSRFVLQVLEARIDHSRVVSILRKADHLPLVKDYLIAVQKANLAAVNDAVNELLIEEEDFKVCASLH